MQQQPYDLHATIARLASAEQRCRHDKVQAWDTPEGLAPCEDCGGTGRTIPFAALRVPCAGGWVPEPDIERACLRTIKAVAHSGYIIATQNDGPGWRADIKENIVGGRMVATGWSDGFAVRPYDPNIPPPYEPGPEEAVLRAAETWLKEKA